MYTLEDFARIVYSYTLTKQKYFAAAERALKNYFVKLMRPEFFGTSSNDVRLDNLLISIANRLGKEDDDTKGIFLEDIVGLFISKDKGDELRAIVEHKIRKDYPQLSISKELSDKLISTNKSLNEEEKGILKKINKSIINLISDYIFKFFSSEYKSWVRKKKKELEVKKEVAPDIEVLPDSELIEKLETEQAWQEGLKKKVFRFINKEAPEKRQHAYKIMVLKRFMAEPSKKMTHKQIEKMTKIPDATLQEWERDLGRMLAVFLSKEGIGPKFVDPGLYKKDVKTPDYKKVLKDIENSKDFKKYLKDSMESKQLGGVQRAEDFESIINLLAEGKNRSEIEAKGYKSKNIYNIKNRYFDKWYKEWYEDMIENIRKTSNRIKKALVYIYAEKPTVRERKRVVIPYEKKERSEFATPSPASHEKAVDRAIQHKDITLTILFSANFDWLDLISEKSKIPIPEDIPETEYLKNKVDFKYKLYTASFERDTKPSIRYTYNQKLNDNGTLEGRPWSRLEIEDKTGSDDLREKFDDYVESKMKPEGVLPYGKSLVTKKSIGFSIKYVNESLDPTKTYDGERKRTYDGVRKFWGSYQDLLVKDAPHITRVELEKKREEGGMKTKGSKYRVREVLLVLKDELVEEKSEKSPDKKRISELTDKIKELGAILKEDQVKKIDEFVERQKERFKFALGFLPFKLAVSEERRDRTKRFLDLKEILKNQEQRLLHLKKQKETEQIAKAKATLKKDIEKSEKEIKELEKLLAETKEPFPPPESAGVKKFLTLLSDLDIKDKIVNEFLTPSDLLFIANQIQAALAEEAEKSIEGIKKNKNMTEQDKKDEIEAINRKRGVKLNEIAGYFKIIPADMKRRLNKYKTEDPDGYEKLEKKHGIVLKWIENPEKALSKVQQKLSAPKVITVPKGKQVVVPMEREEAKDLRRVLEVQLSGINVIGKRFGEASLVPGKVDPKIMGDVEAQLSKAEADLKKTRDELGNVQEQKAEAIDVEKIEELRRSFPEYISTIKQLKSYIRKTKEIPALAIANTLKSMITDFSKMFNKLSKVIWHEPETLEKLSDEGFIEEEMSDLTKLKGTIVSAISKLSGRGISDIEEIATGLKDIRTKLDKFIKLYRLAEKRQSRASIPYEPVTAAEWEKEKEKLKELGTPKEKEEEKEAPKKKTKEEEWKEERVKFIFPAGEMKGAKDIIDRLAQSGKKSLAEMADGARKELKEIISNVQSAYDEFDTGVIKALAKKEDISYQRAAVRLKRIKDSLASSALSEFILKWKEVADVGRKKKEKGPLRKLPSEQYEKILDVVEDEVPELFELAPPEEVPEEPKRGVPTPKKIREKIEKQFSKRAPQFKREKEKPEKLKVEEKYDFYEGEEFPRGKGKGPRIKTRPKPIKKHPPSVAYETLKGNFVKDLKTKDPMPIVLGLMGEYLISVKEHVKAGDYFDVDDVVAGVVDFLAGIKFLIKMVRVGVDPSAASNIILKNYEDALGLFNKIEKIYQIIDKIVAPTKVGPQPGEISKIKTVRGVPDTWFPNGLMKFYQSLKEEKEKKKSAKLLAFQLAQKFAFSDIQSIDNLTEEDLVSIE